MSCGCFKKKRMALLKPHQQVCRVKLRQNHATPLLSVCPSKTHLRSTFQLPPFHLSTLNFIQLSHVGSVLTVLDPCFLFCQEYNHLCNLMAQRWQASSWRASEARSFTSGSRTPILPAHRVITAQCIIAANSCITVKLLLQPSHLTRFHSSVYRNRL